MSQSPERHLLLGLLALQNGFITRDQLVAAFGAWTADKRRALGELLVEQGALTAARRELLEDLVRQHLAAHGNDPQQSLANLNPAAVSDGLRQLRDSEVDTWLTLTLPPSERSDVTCLPSSLGNPEVAGQRFVILRPHASGGLGQVSVALDTELHREIALKEIKPDYAAGEEARIRFVREAEVTGRLEHPSIVPVYGLGMYADGRPYYAMKFIKGDSLRDAIRRLHSLEETKPGGAPAAATPPRVYQSLEFRQLLQRFVAVCQAMQYAHDRGVLHRDLKPDNIMLGEYGETLVVDWGLAKPLGEDGGEAALPASGERPLIPRSSLASRGSETMQGHVVGTPQYMSPEQAAGELDRLGPATDIYALGATLYHLLAGQPPVRGLDLGETLRRVQRGEFPRPRQVQSAIPKPLEAICLKAVALRPADRYATCTALAAEIENYLADEPVLAAPDSAMQRVARFSRKHRGLVATSLLALALIAVGSGVAFVREAGLRSNLANANSSLQTALANETAAKLQETAQRKRAAEEEKKASAAAAAARRSLAGLLLANGQRRQDEGDPSAALLWFSRALPLMSDQGDSIERLHRIRLGLLLRQLPRPVEMWSLPADQSQRLILQEVSPDGKSVAFLGGANYVVVVDVGSGRDVCPPLVHTDLVSSLAFSADSQRLATTSRDQQVHVWDLKSGEPLTPPLKASGQLLYIAVGPDGRPEFSNDGKSLLVTSTSGEKRLVEVWDLEAKQRRYEPLSFEGKLAAVHFSPDGERIFIAGPDEGRLYSTATGQPLDEKLSIPSAWSARFSPDGRWLVTTSGDGQVGLWDGTSGAPVATMAIPQAVVSEAVFSPDSSSLATLSGSAGARLWEIPSGKPIGSPLEHRERPIAARFRDDGEQVLTIALDHSVRVWDAKTGRLIAGPLWSSRFPTAAFAGDRVWLIADGRGTQWDLSRCLDPGAVRVTSATEFNLVEFSPTGLLIAAAGEQAFVIDPNNGAIQGEAIRHDSTITKMAVAPQAKTLALGDAVGSVRQWDLQRRGPVEGVIKHDGPITRIRYNRAGDRLLTCSEDKTARIWDTTTGKQIGKTLEHADAVRDGDFSSDDAVVATGSDDGFFHLWDAKTGHLLGKPQGLQQPGQRITQIRFHHERDLLLVAGQAGELMLLTSPTKDPKPRWLRSGGSVEHAEFSLAKDRLLAAGLANEVHSWNIERLPEPPRTYPGGFMSLLAAFHPSSELLATASFGGARLWEVESSRPLGPPLWNGPQQARATKSLAFSPDSKYLATIDTRLRLWDLSPEHHPAELVEQLATLFASRRLEEDGTLRELSGEEFKSTFDQIGKKWREALDPSPGVTISVSESASPGQKTPP